MTTKEILNSHSVKTLKKEISQTNIKGYSKMRKDEVIELMLKNKEKFSHIKMNEKTKTTPKKEQPKPTPKKEQPKPTPKKEQPKPTPKKEEPKEELPKTQNVFGGKKFLNNIVKEIEVGKISIDEGLKKWKKEIEEFEELRKTKWKNRMTRYKDNGKEALKIKEINGIEKIKNAKYDKKKAEKEKSTPTQNLYSGQTKFIADMVKQIKMGEISVDEALKKWKKKIESYENTRKTTWAKEFIKKGIKDGGIEALKIFEKNGIDKIKNAKTDLKTIEENKRKKQKLKDDLSKRREEIRKQAEKKFKLTGISEGEIVERYKIAKKSFEELKSQKFRKSNLEDDIKNKKSGLKMIEEIKKLVDDIDKYDFTENKPFLFYPRDHKLRRYTISKNAINNINKIIKKMK